MIKKDILSSQLLQSETHWGDRLAERVIAQFPDQEVYTCAAGISPSGIVHFGNFRDLFTAYVVVESLKRKGKQARLVFSWDDFDRFRKVPANIDPSFEQYIGLPYTDVPCPEGKYGSYAERFEKEFEESMNSLGIYPEYIYQTDMYRSGAYDDMIIYSLKKRQDIAEILLSFMPEKTKLAKKLDEQQYKENYYPISVYSRFTGKDNTRVTSYDGESTITYKCLDTDKTDTIDVTKDHIVKLSWKIDWPMRWGREGVVFEPGGHDHASPGGSFDTSSRIANEIFENTPPVLEEYKFVGLQGLGSKMSGSKGNAVAPKDLLEIYTPEILKWLYADKPPAHSFELSFGKGIFRQYDEFDKTMNQLNEGTINAVDRETLALSGVTGPSEYPAISFRQLLGFGQIVQWNETKLKEILDSQQTPYDPALISARLPRAKVWLERYNKDEAVTLLDNFNQEYASSMVEEQINQIGKLRDYLIENSQASIQDIETQVYAIPKQPDLDMQSLAKLQRAFFKDVYSLLVGNSVGPRLSTFLWAADRQKILELLDIESARNS